MTILLVGLNHRTAPVEIREKLALDACTPAEAYQDLRSGALREAIFLSTCNRVEILADTQDVPVALDDITRFLSSQHDLPPEAYKDCLYIHQDSEAVRHLFRVAASLDSMVLGEPQILGQLKNAFRNAVDNASTGAILNKLMHKSFSVAKRVRTETGIASHAVSISFAAVELARKIFGDLNGRHVLLIGAGEMAELAAEHLFTHGASRITVANRTLERAVNMAQRWDGQAASLDELPALLATADIVISSTGAPETVVTASLVKKVQKPRRHRPIFFVDIAVPRDVDPDVNRIDNAYLYDIDDLQSVVEENRAHRQDEAARAERIIEEETIRFQQWMSVLDTYPTVTALTEKAEEIRQNELAKTLGRLRGLSPEHAAALDILTQSLTRKLLHDPIRFIKAAGRHGKKDLNLDLARRVFALDGTERDSSETDGAPENDVDERHQKDD
jgi:glutamyl-tRNA reductase